MSEELNQAPIETPAESHSGDKECFGFVVGCSVIFVLMALLLLGAWIYSEHLFDHF